MAQGDAKSGLYRAEEDIGEKKRGQPLVLPPYKFVKKPREKLRDKPKVMPEATKGPYDAAKPDPEQFQADLEKRFP